METFKIDGVEIFSAGVWNGDEYTMNDLQDMVQAFNETNLGVKPFLKLGHDEEQKLLQMDGLPSAGWITNLYIKGDKLVADFSDIPKKIYELIKAKAYRKVSSEIFYNLKIKDKIYRRLLGAVALLGTDTPGVMNLSDILAMYKLASDEPPRIYKTDFEMKLIENQFSPQEGEKEMSETNEELKKFEADLKAKTEEADALNAELNAKAAALSEKDAEIEALKQFKADAEKRELELAKEAKKAQIEKFVAELQSEKLCTPAMKPLVAELLGDEKKEYSIKIQDEDKKMDKETLFKETLKLFKAASDVNFDENSVEGTKDSKLDDKAINEKIEKYALENKVTYGQAAKAIFADKQFNQTDEE
jgi:hypothetical protein